jgi:ribosomal protein S18 acetylase RimI-like enzyme
MTVGSKLESWPVKQTLPAGRSDSNSYTHKMTPTFHIRECTDADWPQATGLIRSVFFGGGFGSAQRLEQNGRREIIEPAGTTMVAVEAGASGQVLGAVVLAHRGGPLALTAQEGEAEIRMLAVDPQARGRGVGEALVRECLNRAALPPHSAHTMVLHTQPLMVAAQRLYERLGFVRVPERDLTLGPEAQGPAGPSTRERWAYALHMVK